MFLWEHLKRLHGEKKEAGEMHTPPDGETCPLPEQYFLSVTCLLLCQETVLDYTAGWNNRRVQIWGYFG